MTKLGIWPDSPDHQQLLAFEAEFGITYGLYRERGGIGKLDSKLLKVPGDFVGRRNSANLSCSIGTVSTGTAGVPFADVAAGKYDAVIDAYAIDLIAMIAANPGPHFFELQSEANIVNPPGQPDSGSWWPDGQAMFRHVVERWRKAGIRKRNLKFVLTLTQGLYQPDRRTGAVAADTWFAGLTDVIDVVGVDGYSKPVTMGRAHLWADMFDAAVAFATKLGKPLAICETGCEDDPAHPETKVQFYTDALAWTKLKRPSVVVFTADGEWNPHTSRTSLGAYRTLVTDPVWS
jgi:hypothetical protein